MNFPTYDAFRVALQTLIEGEELTDASFSTASLDLMIGLGEERIAHGDDQTPGLRASCMLVKFSDVDTPLEVEDNAVELPADFLQLHEVYFAGKRPLDVVPLKELRTREANGSGGTSAWCAQDGDTIRFWPTAADGPVLGSYFAKPPALATDFDENATVQRYPALYLYACLYECALFLGHEKAPEWEKRYRDLADGAAAAEQARIYGGGSLRVRAR